MDMCIFFDISNVFFKPGADVSELVYEFSKYAEITV
jgi:hypothetical protein